MGVEVKVKGMIGMRMTVSQMSILSLNPSICFKLGKKGETRMEEERKRIFTDLFKGDEGRR